MFGHSLSLISATVPRLIKIVLSDSPINRCRSLWTQALDLSKRSLTEEKAFTEYDGLMASMKSLQGVLQNGSHDEHSLESVNKTILECAPARDIQQMLNHSSRPDASAKIGSLDSLMNELIEALKPLQTSADKDFLRLLQDLWLNSSDLRLSLTPIQMECLWKTAVQGLVFICCKETC